MKKFKFSELKTYLSGAGFLPIENGFNRRVIELRQCPKCEQFFTCKNFADAKDERSFGVCEPCDYAEEFFVNPVEFKSKILRAGR